MKIVVNSCFGGFDLSEEAKAYCGKEWYKLARNSEKLVQCVEELGERASAECADLRVEEIPDEATDWIINDYDGQESILYVIDGKIRG